MEYSTSEHRRAQVRDNMRRYRQRRAETTQVVPREKLELLSAKCDELLGSVNFLHNMNAEVRDTPPIDRVLELLDALIENYAGQSDVLCSELEAESGAFDELALAGMEVEE